MLKCIVRLTRLTDNELGNYQNKVATDSEFIGGYNMRQCQSSSPRLDRLAKYNIKYSSSTDYSSDETYERYPPKKRKIAALSGPPIESIEAHARRQKEKLAAEALLELNNPPADAEDTSDDSQDNVPLSIIAAGSTKKSKIKKCENY